MSTENVATVREIYEAFNQGDLPAMWSLMTPDVSSSGPPVSGLPYSGFHSGPRSVTRAFFQPEAALWENLRASPQTFLETDDSVVVLGFSRGTRRGTGEPLCEPFFHECFLRDGKIARMHSYPESARAMRLPD